MRRTLALRTATAVGLTVATVAAMAGVAPQVHAAGGRHALPNSTPRWLGHAQATRTASPDSAARQSVTVQLAPNGGMAALQAAALAVSTPGSASYRHFLTPSQYAAQYAPTDAEVSAVRSWLTGAGLSVTGVDPGNDVVTASGSRAALQQAFGVSLQSYRHDGQDVVAPNGPTYVPDSLAGTVLAVGGLDTTTYTSATQHTTGTGTGGPAATTDAYPPAFVNARPCSAYYGQVAATYQADYTTPLPAFQGSTLPYAVCGYTGPQFRAAYEGSSTLTGAGVTVGVIDAYASPSIAQDAEQYATNHGDGAYAPGQLTQTVASGFTHKKLCGPTGWYGEETLDVEAVHAMAPGAGIHYYGAASCLDDDLLAAAREAVRQDAVQVISNSYGDLEQNATAAYVAASEKVFSQGALEGISFLFSSGDNGDELAASGIKQVDYQASDPLVTAVGGTATAIGANGKIAFQTGWGTDKDALSSDDTSWTPVGYLYGSGGGFSALFNRPSYQDGVVGNAARGVPDVAMDADPTTGMLVGETQLFPDGTARYGEYRIGGTSLASPLFAGLTALRVQAGGGTGFGLLNPSIYAAAKSAFTDVKGAPKDAGNVRVDYVNGVDATAGLVYSVRTFDQDSSLQVTQGWDDVTGVGVPTPSWITSGSAS